MRHYHDGPIYDDSGRRSMVYTGKDPEKWSCDDCGQLNHRTPGDDWPTCCYCGRFRDHDVSLSYGWYE